MGSRAAQGLWPGFLVSWGWRLCSAVGLSLSGWKCRLGSVAGTALWLGVQSRQNCQPSSPARCGHWLGSANEQSHLLEPVLAASSVGTGSTGIPAPAAASRAPPPISPLFRSCFFRQWSPEGETLAGLLGSVQKR